MVQLIYFTRCEPKLRSKVHGNLIAALTVRPRSGKRSLPHTVRWRAVQH